jgi:small-conductance mechanosensitive channel/CRP-like cAMP-binding protein
MEIPQFLQNVKGTWIAYLLTLACILGLLILRQFTREPRIRRRALIAVVLFLVFVLLRAPLFFLDATMIADGKRIANPPYQVFDILSLLVFSWASIQGLILLLVNFFLVERLKIEVPKILSDVALVSLFILSILVIFYFENLNITGIFTTAGVLSIVIGLALQDTLGNAFAGLALQTERPFKVGDWISFGSFEGIVTDVSWRSTQFRTRNNDLVNVPNSTISKESFINHSAPSPISARIIHVGVAYRHTPEHIKRVLLAACREVEGILERPRPLVRLHSFDSSSINYQIKFWIRDWDLALDIDEAYRTLLWYAFRREEIEIPYPIQVEYQHEYQHGQEDQAEKTAVTERVLERLKNVELLAPLSGEELHTLAERAKLHSYYRDETIIRQGEHGDSFFILDEGEVIVCVTKDGHQEEVARLAPPAALGEMALLTGEKRAATVRAASPVRILVIDRDAFKDIILANPDLATSMSELLARRHVELLAKREALDKSLAEAQRETSHQILAKIRDFFGFRV